MIDLMLANYQVTAVAFFAVFYIGMELLVWRHIFANAGDTTLLIIDMQDNWPCSRPIIGAVVREIELAKKYGWNIVLVEFHGVNRRGKPTHRAILDALATARVPKITVEKSKEDGGEVILDACAKHGFGTRNFRVAGIMLLQCLGLTCGTIARRLPQSNLHLVREATNCDFDLAHRDYYHEPNSRFVDQEDVEAQLAFAAGTHENATLTEKEHVST